MQPMSRDVFDKLLTDFAKTVAETITAAPRACPYLDSIAGMLASLRYQDRLYTDLCAFARVLKPGARVLDIGTGCGIAGFMLAAQGFEIQGIDVDNFNEAPEITDGMAGEQQMLWHALVRKQPNVHFQHYHDSRVPFADSSFDAVVGYGVIEHIPEAVLDRVMSEIRRVTKPAGHLFISYLPRQWAWLELVLALLGRPHHQRRWGDREILRFLTGFGYQTEVFKRIIFAPQFPASFTNRHKTLFDRFDTLANILPFAFFARDIFIIAKYGDELAVDGTAESSAPDARV
jgi:SAM-dependent methyltransferase